MRIEPAIEIFAERYRRGEAQVAWTTLVADLETPVSAFLKIAGGKPMSFLLESVEGGAVRGRYSIIGLDPDVIWRANGPVAEINRAARGNGGGFTVCLSAGRSPVAVFFCALACMPNRGALNPIIRSYYPIPVMFWAGAGVDSKNAAFCAGFLYYYRRLQARVELRFRSRVRAGSGGSVFLRSAKFLKII